MQTFVPINDMLYSSGHPFASTTGGADFVIHYTGESPPAMDYSLLAGFVDSDGWVGKLANRYWRITIVQKSRVILDYLREEAGGIGNIYRRKNGVHVWTTTSQSFLEELNQYLKIKRKNMN